MLDLRKRNQRYRGFYIWKKQEKRVWAVGLNGTSCHTIIPFGSSAKDEIRAFVINHQQYRNV